MANPQQVVEGLWMVPLGPVNAFLLDQGELTLIDTGMPKDEGKIVAAIEAIGRKATDLKHIIVTHCHPDHAGSVAALKRLSGARVYMHPVDAAMVRKGECTRPLTPAPGLMRGLMFRMFIPKTPPLLEPCAIDQEINDGTELPIAGGLKALHVPGQCAGQLAFLWPRRRVLFAADAASNMMGLGLSLGYESLQQGLDSLRKLAALDFDIACFGHGKPIMSAASARFREKW
jgi:glyoxylase-like metal-dependent hydrolase (beta-lactamase superfamily II)